MSDDERPGLALWLAVPLAVAMALTILIGFMDGGFSFVRENGRVVRLTLLTERGTAVLVASAVTMWSVLAVGMFARARRRHAAAAGLFAVVMLSLCSSGASRWTRTQFETHDHLVRPSGDSYVALYVEGRDPLWALGRVVGDGELTRRVEIVGSAETWYDELWLEPGDNGEVDLFGADEYGETAWLYSFNPVTGKGE